MPLSSHSPSVEQLLQGASSLVDVLVMRADRTPTSVAYTFLVDGESEEDTLTYEALDRSARAIGAALSALGASGRPVLLLHPPGLAYVAAVCGCLYAGAIAVPAYPPDPTRLQRTLPRLRSLVADAGATIALTTAAIKGMVGALAEQAPELAALQWVASDAVDDCLASTWRAPPVGRDRLAIIQYTSGSTAAPRGVMLSHGNLLNNLWHIHRCFGHGPQSRGLIWLPPYHDMGLIGGVLQPLYGGFPVTLMSPLHFLERPLRWLRAITRYQATTSGGPNFAYDLCVRKISPEDRETLDLRSWDLAFNGAEPIRAETLDRFATIFAPAGFRREAFYTCYGLAEATLIASGGDKAAAPVVQVFEGEALAAGRARRAPEGAERDARTLVGSGQQLSGQRLLIVHPETGIPLEDGEIGEIWVAGPSVALGYWRRETETEATFRARGAAGADSAFLRTGDLGFLDHGELFVVGRSKDLLIIRGRNYYPQDIEQTAERSHPGVRAGCTAAFSIDEGGLERVAIVAEIDPRRCVDAAEVVEAIRLSVAAEHELLVHTVIAVGPGSVPKTSSGKVQRRACRAMLLTGALTPLSAIRAAPLAPTAGDGDGEITKDSLHATAPADREALVVGYLRARAARLCGLEPAHSDPRRSLLGQGLDSLGVVELKSRIEADLGVGLPLGSLLEAPDLVAISRAIVAAFLAPATAPRVEPAPPGEPRPLSFAQRRLWFLHRLAPASTAYSLPFGLSLEGEVDVAALAAAFDEIVQRHEALRATLVEAQPEPRLSACEGRLFALTMEDLGHLDASAAEESRQRIVAEEARRPFDLSRGPLFRARLVRISDRQHVLLLTLHHLVADGWSMGVLMRELSALYQAFRAGDPSPLPPPPALQYGDFAWSERRWLDEARCEGLLSYWREQLAGAPPLLTLSASRPRPAVQTFRGEHHPFELPAEIVSAAAALGRREEATPFMVLLASLLLVLHAEGAGDDLVVGTDVAGRTWSGTDALVGLFVNQLVLRTKLTSDPTGRELVRRARAVTIKAFAHQDLPFDKLVEGLRPARDPGYNPLFQVMFVLENAPLPLPSLAGLHVTLMQLESVGSPFDLSLLLSPAPGGALHGLLRYNADLFDAPTMERVAASYPEALTALTAHPEERLSALVGRLRQALEERRSGELDRMKEARLDRWKNLKRKGRG